MKRKRILMMTLVAAAVPAILLALGALRSAPEPATARTIVYAETMQERPPGLYYTYRHPSYDLYQQCGRSHCAGYYPAQKPDRVIVLGRGIVEGPIAIEGRQVYR